MQVANRMLHRCTLRKYAQGKECAVECTRVEISSLYIYIYTTTESLFSLRDNQASMPVA